MALPFALSLHAGAPTAAHPGLCLAWSIFKVAVLESVQRRPSFNASRATTSTAEASESCSVEISTLVWLVHSLGARRTCQVHTNLLFGGDVCADSGPRGRHASLHLELLTVRSASSWTFSTSRLPILHVISHAQALRVASSLVSPHIGFIIGAIKVLTVVMQTPAV